MLKFKQSSEFKKTSIPTGTVRKALPGQDFLLVAMANREYTIKG